MDRGSWKSTGIHSGPVETFIKEKEKELWGKYKSIRNGNEDDVKEIIQN